MSALTFKPVVISASPMGGYDVEQDGKTAGGGLTMGELLELVLRLTQYDVQRPRYPMLTPAEWHERYPHLHPPQENPEP